MIIPAIESAVVAAVKAAVKVPSGNATVITGSGQPGTTLESTAAKQWFLNGSPISGATATTYEIPWTANIGDIYTQADANSVTVPEWFDSIIAFWDFAESAPPYTAKAGTATFSLGNGTGASVTTVSEGPFGKAASFDGATDYLRIAAASVGDLNLSQFGNECSVISWVKRESNAVGFIAGIWQENDTDPRRQYGLFVDLPLYGGDDRVCGHISKSGGATPGYPFAREYSATSRFVRSGTDYRFMGLTYNGAQIVSHLDGIPDSYPTYTDPVGNTYSKNPFIFADGLNNTTLGDFSMGAVQLTTGWSNWFEGKIGGVAIFKKALSHRQMMWIHRQRQPLGLPLFRFEFHSFQIHEGTESYASTFGWSAVRGATATNTSGVLSAQNFESILLNSRHFFFRAGNNTGNTNTTLAAMGYFDQIRGIDFSQIGTAQFLLNNSHAADTVRFCVCIAGTWYASETTYSVTGNGRTGSDWTTAELKTVTFTRAANTWRALTLTPGSTLALGSTIATVIPDGELQGVGFYSPNLAGSTSIVRIGTLDIFRP